MEQYEPFIFNVNVDLPKFVFSEKKSIFLLDTKMHVLSHLPSNSQRFTNSGPFSSQVSLAWWEQGTEMVLPSSYDKDISLCIYFLKKKGSNQFISTKYLIEEYTSTRTN